jgi:hypothetical protein
VTGRIPFAGKNMSRFHVRATLIPQLQTQTLSYDYKGRKMHYPLEKAYSSWSMSIIDDDDPVDLWAAFQKWQNELNEHERNTSNSNVVNHNPDNFKTTWTVQQLNLNGNESSPIKKFSLYGCWPKVINPINLNMNRPNTINVFDVVMLYDYITIDNVSD